MTKVAINVPVVERLARHANIVGLKDSDGNLAFFEEVARVAGEVDDFSAFTGGDNMLYPALAVGGQGIIGATVNVMPDVERAIYDAFQAGDHARALELQRQLNAKGGIARIGVFPAGFKGTLAARGLCGTTMTRPIPGLTESELGSLREQMSVVGLLSESAVVAD
jgi:4-hydroxy-tetrahydrodipicolinate synthase